MVRAKDLSAKSLISAMEQGDFYASSGVVLSEIIKNQKGYSVKVSAQPGVNYRIDFVGTRRGTDTRGEPVLDKQGQPLRVTRRYSEGIGEVLLSTNGTEASYQLRGDEIYVRAKVTSSRLRYPNDVGGRKDGKSMETYESAWTQPWVP
jgi:hypothetical protein